LRRLLGNPFLEVSLWLALLLLPALVTLGSAPPQFEPRLAEMLGVEEERGLASLWFAIWGDTSTETGAAWVRLRIGVASAWLLMSVAVVLFVSSACGRLAAGAALLLMAVHPVLRDFGTLATQWLPAAVFTWISWLFLQAVALPTVYRRKSATWSAFAIRLLAMAGSGIALGIASSAWARLTWSVLVVGSLFLLSLVFIAVAAWRIRHRRHIAHFVERPWPWIRRSGVWAIAWFVVISLLSWIWSELGEELAPVQGRFGIRGPRPYEYGFAWASLPGILLLGVRTGVSLWYRSRLNGRAVLFVTLLIAWLFGPAMMKDPDPMQRILAVPVFAASLGSLLEGLRLGRR
jgi:hypothetical protein